MITSLKVLSILAAIFLSSGIASCTKVEAVSLDPMAANARQQSDLVSNAFPHTKQYSSEVANVWFMTLTEVIKVKPFFSSQAIRLFAYSGLALYESVIPGMPSKSSILEGLTGQEADPAKRKDYYWPAAANAAIARVASRIIQTYPAPDLTLVKRVEDSIRQSFPSHISSEELQRSIEYGTRVADIIFDWSMKDGTYNPNGTVAQCPPYVVSSVPGSWQPTPPAFFPAAGPCQGKLRTFVPDIAISTLPEPPPPYSTEPGSAFYTAAEEVYVNNTMISQDERLQFENWRDINTYYIPLSHIIRIAAGIFRKEKVNLEDAAELYMKMTIASHDAVNAVFNAKYTYALIRPVTYIRGVLNKPSWLSLPVTPQTPSYPDEMSATAASVQILESHFGQQYAFTDSTNKRNVGQWQYGSLDEMLLSIEEARVSAGTNFRFSTQAGMLQGRAIGEIVDRLPFRRTP